MFGKKEQEQLNLLTLIPQRRRDYDIDEQGIVTVHMPRFESAWMRKYLVPKRRNPFVHTRLDAVGSFVWQQCDGVTSVAGIAERMREHFGEDAEPVHDRLALFIRVLFRRTWISLHHEDGTAIQ